MNKLAENWIQLNYTTLEFWSKRWAGDEWSALLSHLTFYLDKNWSKMAIIPDNEGKIKWCQQWMKNSTKWRRSTFRRDIDQTEQVGIEDLTIEIDIVEQSYIELAAEPGELGKLAEMIEDFRRVYTDEQISKILHAWQMISQLDESEKILMTMYINSGMSMRDIAKKTRLPLSAIWSMLQDIKNKIKNDFNNF